MRIDRIKLVSELARRDISLKALSEKSGVSRSTLTSVKSGKSCSISTAKQIACALGISLEDLVLQEV